MDVIYRKRCKRYDIPNQAHCLTFSCFQQRPFFSRPRSCQWMLDALLLGKQKQMYHLLAYVIMPEHVHLIVVPKEQVLIRHILTTIKQSVSKRAILWVRQNAPAFLKQMEDRQPNGEIHHRFWQRGGGYDRNLRSRDDITEKIEYIHSNPVRRKLVEKCSDWPWSSHNVWTTGTNEPIPIDRHILF
jgi:putative transposase